LGGVKRKRKQFYPSLQRVNKTLVEENKTERLKRIPANTEYEAFPLSTSMRNFLPR